MDDREKDKSKAVDENRSDANDAGQEPHAEDIQGPDDTSVEVHIKANGAADEEADEDAAVDTDRAEAKEEPAEEVQEESERFLRLAAEFDNYKKRTAREFGDIIRRANERILRELVDILDSFERALAVESDDHNSTAYRQGVELIYNQLTGLLSKEGVTSIDSVGTPFDPIYHEAVMQVESDEYGEGIVAQEVQKGYKINDKVLRHARVVVSKGRPTDGGEPVNESDE